jgi:VanZ family protein
MFHRVLLTTAWACLLFVALATLVPLHLRPHLTGAETLLSVLIEHVGAFAVLGFLFSISYPRRYGLICSLVFGSAILLEALQIFVPDRDARIIDAIEKLAGGGAGIVGASWLLSVVAFRVQRQV